MNQQGTSIDTVLENLAFCCAAQNRWGWRRYSADSSRFGTHRITKLRYRWTPHKTTYTMLRPKAQVTPITKVNRSSSPSAGSPKSTLELPPHHTQIRNPHKTGKGHQRKPLECAQRESRPNYRQHWNKFGIAGALKIQKNRTKIERKKKHWNLGIFLTVVSAVSKKERRNQL